MKVAMFQKLDFAVFEYIFYGLLTTSYSYIRELYASAL